MIGFAMFSREQRDVEQWWRRAWDRSINASLPTVRSSTRSADPDKMG